MPVIIKKQDEELWLEKNSNLADILSLLKPYPDKKMIAYSVSREVNNPKNNYPSLIHQIK